ncbi:MAG: peptidoglycan-binding domain-containing protein [Steroidobacteraceae bacterium]
MKKSGWLLIGMLSASIATAEAPTKRLADVQARLNALGYDAGAADGVMGKGTARAIRNFQRVVSLPVTGEHDAELEAQLFSPCSAKMAKPFDGSQGGFQISFEMRATGGCYKPTAVAEKVYRVCIRPNGDCSVPGPNGVTDAFVTNLSEPLE